jgi:hypothetical protein
LGLRCEQSLDIAVPLHGRAQRHFEARCNCVRHCNTCESLALRGRFDKCSTSECSDGISAMCVCALLCVRANYKAEVMLPTRPVQPGQGRMITTALQWGAITLLWFNPVVTPRTQSLQGRVAHKGSITQWALPPSRVRILASTQCDLPHQAVSCALGANEGVTRKRAVNKRPGGGCEDQGNRFRCMLALPTKGERLTALQGQPPCKGPTRSAHPCTQREPSTTMGSTCKAPKLFRVRWARCS